MKNSAPKPDAEWSVPKAWFKSNIIGYHAMRTFPLLLLAATSLLAQPPAVNSPEVHPDRRVTFRIHAPKASEVKFYGDWMPVNTSTPMTRGDNGIWSLVTDPLPPSIYLYSFNVDGMTIADPINPRVKLRSRTSASMVEVPGTPGELWQPRDIPHGAVEINWQNSKVINNEARWIWVYTPPGYEKNPGKRYPVLYLFHGSNDIAGGWVLAGQANFILDNLIADKKAAPMIVVMPYGHAVPFGAPRDVQAKNTSIFEEYVLKDVMPFVEAKYRIAKGRDNQAIAGLSMGGGQSLSIGFNHPSMFSAVGAFSAAVPQNLEPKLDAVAKSGLKLIWMACGKDDSLVARSNTASELLKKHGIKHVYKLTDGAHTYTVWRQYLGEFAPLLFHN